MTQTLNLGCGPNPPRKYHNADAKAYDGVDEVVDLNDTPWPWEDNSWAEIRMSHVLEHLESVEDALAECQRILKPNGTLKVYWPIGIDERADPDHKHTWVWDTPEMYCGARPWDADVGLTVKRREVRIWANVPGIVGFMYSGFIRVLDDLTPDGRWQFDVPATSGEFTVVFTNED
jgi:SAM-dependent methyltransferase